jgi:hypothetical protein
MIQENVGGSDILLIPDKLSITSKSACIFTLVMGPGDVIFKMGRFVVVSWAKVEN